jgi:hypothetical protein
MTSCHKIFIQKILFCMKLSQNPKLPFLPKLWSGIIISEWPLRLEQNISKNVKYGPTNSTKFEHFLSFHFDHKADKSHLFIMFHTSFERYWFALCKGHSLLTSIIYGGGGSMILWQLHINEIFCMKIFWQEREEGLKIPFFDGRNLWTTPAIKKRKGYKT